MGTSKKSASPYGAKKFKDIDDYHASFPSEVQEKLSELRIAIKKAAPKATELISYNMPAFRLNTNLVYYAAHKQHIGFYPTTNPIKIFAEELKSFTTSKGAIQFPYDKKLPLTLIKKIVQLRVEEDTLKAKTKK